MIKMGLGSRLHASGGLVQVWDYMMYVRMVAVWNAWVVIVYNLFISAYFCIFFGFILQFRCMILIKILH